MPSFLHRQAGPTLSSKHIPLHSSNTRPDTISMQDLLPEDIVEAKSINRFKVGLDKSMQDKGPSVDDHLPLLSETCRTC